jgi:hypothetical protein
LRVITGTLIRARQEGQRKKGEHRVRGWSDVTATRSHEPRNTEKGWKWVPPPPGLQRNQPTYLYAGFGT